MNVLQALKYVSEGRPVQVSFDEGKTWPDLCRVGEHVVGSIGLGVFNSNNLDLLQFRLKPSIENLPTYHIITPSDSEGPDYNRTIMSQPFDRHTIPLNAWYRDPNSPNVLRRITSLDDGRISFDGGFMTYEGLKALGWEYSEDGRTNWNPCHQRDV